MARFLSYDGIECTHEHARFLRSIDDIKAWLSQDDVGTSETAITRWWKMSARLRPDIRIVVVRRPIEESHASMMALDLRGAFAFDPDLLRTELHRLDRALDQIERDAPNVLSVRYADLNDEATCAAVFEHTLGRPHDGEWWRSLKDINVQCNMPALMRYFVANRKQIVRTARACRRDYRSLLKRVGSNHPPEDVDGVEFQEEPFDTMWAEGGELFRAHAEEVGTLEGSNIDPNNRILSKLDEMELLLVLTARHKGRLIGYLLTVIAPSLQDKNLLTGTQSSFFVERRYRGIGHRMQLESVERLRRRGVGEVYFRAGVRGDGPRTATLYRRMGAVPFGEMFNLRLGVS